MPHIINKVIPDCQYGYKSNVGLHNLHIDVQKLILESLDNKGYHGEDLVFLDLSDAFNTISHTKLLQKLSFYEIRGKFYEIICDLFKSRTQRVKYLDKYSDETN